MRGDSAYFFWIIALGVALVLSVLVARSNSQRANREKIDRLSAQEENRRKDAELAQVRKAHAEALSAKDAEYAKLVERVRGVAKVIEQRKIQFPWLASAIADFHALQAERDAKRLQHKKHPATKAAEEVRAHSK